ncbi:MAG: PaaI family thioesterase [Pirellulales bacterium]|nr:PaaI family thioesterase [Pirellulales bacterium]
MLTREQFLQMASDFPFFRLIGLEILDMQPGWSKTQVTYRPDLCQPAGIMHGGVIASLIDTGIAHALLLTDAFREVAAVGGAIVSVDLRVKYLRPVSEGIIICESKIPRIGRQLFHAESVVVNAEGKEVARGDSIYMAVRPEKLVKQSEPS